jgi:[NiFe] hydrogenase assembly HybE family chaperone
MSDPGLNDSPAAALEAAFHHIAETRMADLPFLNPALTVRAVGFRLWRGEWMGVLISPWFMNLICLPGPDRAWRDNPGGSRAIRALPKGEVEFLHAREDRIGPYLSCSLFSHMGDFADMGQARTVAEAVLKELFEPTGQVSAGPASDAGADLSARLERPVSRRGFLTALMPDQKRS